MPVKVRYIVVRILRVLLCIYHIFPIKSNRVLFMSYNGKQYSCNPRQISEYLNEKYEGQFEIVWAFRKSVDKNIPSYIKTVRFPSLVYYYYAKTARVIIENAQGFGEYKRRKKQDLIQTWHASNGYKILGQNRFTPGSVNAKLVLLEHKGYTYVMCGCESMIERRVRQSMDFHGPVLNGTPRMDMVIHYDGTAYRDKVCQYLGISTDSKILLYAPTWRDDRKVTDYGLDYAKLKDALVNRFGGDWIIAVRLHPHVREKVETEYDFVRDATKYPDMQELICVADAMITDYSSCIWDFSFTYRPCFLFCNDLEKYRDGRAFDIPIEQWHFPIAQTMDELVGLIAGYNDEENRRNIDLHHKEMGNLEDGHATQRVCTLIHVLCTQED